MPINDRPVSRQAWPVLPAPMNGSSTVQAGAATSSSSLSRGTGLAVRWSLSLSTQCAKQPGRQRSWTRESGPLLAKMTNSHCCRNRPFWGLDGVCHGRQLTPVRKDQQRRAVPGHTPTLGHPELRPGHPSPLVFGIPEKLGVALFRLAILVFVRHSPLAIPQRNTAAGIGGDL